MDLAGSFALNLVENECVRLLLSLHTKLRKILRELVCADRLFQISVSAIGGLLIQLLRLVEHGSEGLVRPAGLALKFLEQRSAGRRDDLKDRPNNDENDK